MEVTWKISSNAGWHDGTPFTSADPVFTTTVHQDKEAPQFYNATYDRIERVEAPDPLTFFVIFGRPYRDADKLFTW